MTTLGLVWLTFAMTIVSGVRYVTAAAHVLRSQGEARGS